MPAYYPAAGTLDASDQPSFMDEFSVWGARPRKRAGTGWTLGEMKGSRDATPVSVAVGVGLIGADVEADAEAA
jgi:hypothetical protein